MHADGAAQLDPSLLTPLVEGDYGVFHAHEDEHIPETTGVHSIIYLRADESMWECVGSCCGGKGLRMKLSQERLGKLASRYPDLPWLRLRQERFP